jgi:C-terminal processing protease CtpA/Prc
VNPISGTNWEGAGVIPDVVVKSDDALGTAQRLALQKLLAGATGDRRDELRKLLDGNPAR